MKKLLTSLVIFLMPLMTFADYVGPAYQPTNNCGIAECYCDIAECYKNYTPFFRHLKVILAVIVLFMLIYLMHRLYKKYKKIDPNAVIQKPFYSRMFLIIIPVFLFVLVYLIYHSYVLFNSYKSYSKYINYYNKITVQLYDREDKNNLDINYYDNSEPLNNSLDISDNNLEYDFDKSWSSEFFYQLQKDEANVPLPTWWVDGDWPLATVNFPPKLAKGEVPRVIFWWGTRLHYYDTEQKKFLVEPDLEISNSSYDMLSFCRRYYPNTVSVKKYKREQPLLWDNNLQNYKIPTVKPWSFECVQ